MHNRIKSFITTPFVCLILIISLIALPINATARTGTLGTESPQISCTFTDYGGKVVSGDHIKPGEYTLDFQLTGMSGVSIFQIMGTYDTTKISDLQFVSANNRFTLGGQVVSSGKFAAFLVSNSANTTAVNSQGIVMLTYTVTVTANGDFADMMQLSVDPNCTFVEADYGDGYYDCYVLDTTIEYSAGTTYAASADLSPYVAPTEFDVTGKITVASDVTGTPTSYGLADVAVSVDGEDVTTMTDNTGSYTLVGLEPGSYNITISSGYSADRKATLVVSADDADYDTITANNVGLVPCDYNKDGYINAVDVFTFSRSAIVSQGKADFNKDGVTDESDAEILRTSFLGQSVDYASVSLK